MDCSNCGKESSGFVGGLCVTCHPVWFSANKSHLRQFGCVLAGCPTQKQYTLGLCIKHALEFWTAGGISPNPKGQWFNPDGTRMRCSHDGCVFVVSSSGLCKHHYQNAHYETSRGRTKKSKNIKRVNYDGSKVLCSFEGCWGKVHASGMCPGHYEQKLSGEVLRPLYRTVKCQVGVCVRQVSVRKSMTGLCNTHGHFRTRYGLSNDQVISLFLPESRVCQNPGCLDTENLHLDHDHACCPQGKSKASSCGKCVRGWLCRTCNIGLGMLQENPRKIQGLLDYVARF